MGRAVFSIAHTLEQIRSLAAEPSSSRYVEQVSQLSESGLMSVQVLLDCIRERERAVETTSLELRRALEQVLSIQDQALSYQEQALAIQHDAKALLERLSDHVHPGENVIY
ncbi:hypothetical protein QCE73_37055 [Caballeronia sp. LZ029]|uniref:hypothetical protein n=1 Tax=Caballeronia sp. LZ029 TaxID=3038564 RepID=UPI002863528A|nr:hypothetical protein [Caballeronia sp. LZ029]MDR5748794.1 hypothetical protein [Caballeronia sp. LZ029]